MDILNVCEKIRTNDFKSYIGKVDKVVGMAIEVSGIKASIGDMCYIEKIDQDILAEVIGFNKKYTVLMPYTSTSGITAGNLVRNTGKRLKIPVGDFLKGRIIDAMGEPIDGLEEFENPKYAYIDEPEYVNPLARPAINERINFGVKAIDGMLTIGKGQRIGVFAGSGVGKSTIMGMIAKNVTADVNVIALVGERGREVLEFIERDLGKDGLSRSVLVIATSDQPAMLRMKCAQVATTIAEYFKNQGQDVLLMMDSLTRFAMAQREIGLAANEPPIARGYTPSIYAELPKLLERSGNFKEGSITGVYTVLVEGDDTNEPIADTVRGILDGHIVLSRTLAARNHFPAIDVLESVSRLMSTVATKEHQEIASALRDILSVYNQNYDLVSIGAYKEGANKKLDDALIKIDGINSFLKQKTNENFTYEEMMNAIKSIL